MGEVQVGRTGVNRTTGMVMGQHHCRALVVQCAKNDFAGVDAGLAQSAPEQSFHANQPVLRIQKQHGKLFMWFVRQMKLQKKLNTGGALHDFARAKLLSHGALGQFHDR